MRSSHWLGTLSCRRQPVGKSTRSCSGTQKTAPLQKVWSGRRPDLPKNLQPVRPHPGKTV